MSKSTIKKLLQSMTKAEIIEMVLELYSARKEAKEYLEFYACPDQKGKLEEYKSIIREEFYPKKRREPQTRFSVCRKAVADFKKLKPSADALAELMVSYMEGLPSSPTTMVTCGNNTTTPLKTTSTRLSSTLQPTDCGRNTTSDFSNA